LRQPAFHVPSAIFFLPPQFPSRAICQSKQLFSPGVNYEVAFQFRVLGDLSSSFLASQYSLISKKKSRRLVGVARFIEGFLGDALSDPLHGNKHFSEICDTSEFLFESRRSFILGSIGLKEMNHPVVRDIGAGKQAVGLSRKRSDTVSRWRT